MTMMMMTLTKNWTTRPAFFKRIVGENRLFQCRRNKVKQGEIRVSDYNGFLMYMEFSAFLSWV